MQHFPHVAAQMLSRVARPDFSSVLSWNAKKCWSCSHCRKSLHEHLEVVEDVLVVACLVTSGRYQKDLVDEMRRHLVYGRY